MAKKLTKEEKNEKTFPPILTSSIEECNALFDLFLQQTNDLVEKYSRDYRKLEENIKFLPEENGKLQIPLRKYRHYKLLSEAVSQDEKMIEMCPKFTISHLVQIYDIFLTRFLTEILLVYPGVESVCDKALKMEHHKDAKTLEDVKLAYIKMQVEELMRDSHINQIKWIDKKLKTDLEKFPFLKDFVFLTELRNIIIHNDGIINGIFKSNLKKFGIDVSGYKLNARLSISYDIMQRSFSCIIAFIVFIYASLCRKILKKEDALCSVINDSIIYEYLCEHKYKRVHLLATLLLESDIKLPKETEDTIKVNLAIAYKKSNNDKYKNIASGLESEECDIQLAKAVLLDDYETAVKLFKDLGCGAKFYRGSFEWPLFDGFRDMEEFKQAFKEIFGEDFDDINESEVLNKEKSFHSESQDDDRIEESA